MNILIISELNDFLQSKKIHFSLMKGYEFAKGLTKIYDTIYYLTIGKTEKCDNINLININEITSTFLENIKYLILIRETNIFDILEKSESLKDFLINKKNM